MRRIVVAAACASIFLPVGAHAPAAAQQPLPIDVADQVFAGGELEEYLRLLQNFGRVGAYPWSIRAFGRADLARLETSRIGHPWVGRYDFDPAPRRGLQAAWIQPETRSFYNSAFPYGYNDGAVWAGKGFTSVARVGGSLRYGPLTLVVAPEVFLAQNAAFSHPIPWPGDVIFRDPVSPTSIDLPQRFGDGAYARLGPGQSSLRLDLRGVTVGLSAANQVWGPAWEQPLILSNNAAGFPHLHVGTTAPADVWIGRVHGRVLWGALEQSDYAPPDPRSPRRFAAGMTAVFEPRGLSGLEIGGARFFHRTWREGGPNLEDLLWPFQAFLKEGLEDTGSEDLSNEDNQLASVFARWNLPAAGAEVYAEYAREDHSWNLRDLALEPDHDSGYVIGMAKGWMLPSDRIVSFRAELLNSQVTHLERVRRQTPLYRHSQQRQGHTHLGQILGASAGYAGGHARVAVDLYHPRGRWGAGLTRSLRRSPLTSRTGETLIVGGADVMYAPEISGTYFLGRFEVGGAVSPIYEFNRDHLDDAFNFNARLQLRARL